MYDGTAKKSAFGAEKLIISLHRRKDKRPEDKERNLHALFELRSKSGFASAKFGNEFPFCIRLTRSLTLLIQRHLMKAWGWKKGIKKKIRIWARNN